MTYMKLTAANMTYMKLTAAKHIVFLSSFGKTPVFKRKVS